MRVEIKILSGAEDFNDCVQNLLPVKDRPALTDAEPRHSRSRCQLAGDAVMTSRASAAGDRFLKKLLCCPKSWLISGFIIRRLMIS
jgi:hypothetical protein